MSKKEVYSPEMSRALSKLTLTNIFFTALVYNMKIEAKEDLPAPAATDGVHLYYHPEKFKAYSEADRIFILGHEVLHTILMHSMRRGIRTMKGVTPSGEEVDIWNIACDYCVNGLMAEHDFKNVPKDGIQPDAKYRGMSAEEIYDDLVKNLKPNPNGQGSGQGDGNGKAQGKGAYAPDPGGMGGDVIDYNPANNEGKPRHEVEREIGINTEKAAQAAKASGDMSAGLRRFIQDAQVENEPWHQHLRRFMTSLHSRQYNWARLDARRAVAFGIVSPQMKTEQMGKIVVGVDCSGSVNEIQLASMGAHVSDICRECNPKEVIVVYFDARVCHVDRYEGPQYDIRFSPHGGGGTCFEPVFDLVEEEHSDAQVLLMMTDMYAQLDRLAEVVDTVWVTQTETIPPPFGEMIFADFNE